MRLQAWGGRGSVADMNDLRSWLTCAVAGLLALGCGGADDGPTDPYAQLRLALGIFGGNGFGADPSGPDGLGATGSQPDGLGSTGARPDGLGATGSTPNGLGETGSSPDGVGRGADDLGASAGGGDLCGDLCVRAVDCGFADGLPACLALCRSFGQISSDMDRDLRACLDRGCGGFERCIDRALDDDDSAETIDVSPGRPIDGSSGSAGAGAVPPRATETDFEDE